MTVKHVRIAVVCVLLLAGIWFIGIPEYQKFHLRQELKAQNIYEICREVKRKQEDEDMVKVEVFYMICDPPTTPSEVQSMVQDYLDTHNTVDELRALVAPENAFIDITFIRPTKRWPIGKFPTEDRTVELFDGMFITAVFIEPEDTPEGYRYFYLSEDGDYFFIN